MAVYNDQVPVGTSAVRLDVARGWKDSASGSCVFRNRGAGPIFVGKIGVTTSTGFQLDPGESVSIDLRGSDAVYGVAGSGTQTCHILQTDGAR